MGRLGKGLFKSTPRLFRELQRAYADEWFGHYNFLHASWLLGGTEVSAEGKLLQRKSQEALSRAETLGRRLLELGDEPVPKLTDLPATATNKTFKLPRRRTDRVLARKDMC